MFNSQTENINLCSRLCFKYIRSGQMHRITKSKSTILKDITLKTILFFIKFVLLAQGSTHRNLFTPKLPTTLGKRVHSTTLYSVVEQICKKKICMKCDGSYPIRHRHFFQNDKIHVFSFFSTHTLKWLPISILLSAWVFPSTKCKLFFQFLYVHILIACFLFIERRL